MSSLFNSYRVLSSILIWVRDPTSNQRMLCSANTADGPALLQRRDEFSQRLDAADGLTSPLANVLNNSSLLVVQEQRVGRK